MLNLILACVATYVLSGIAVALVTAHVLKEWKQAYLQYRGANWLCRTHPVYASQWNGRNRPRSAPTNEQWLHSSAFILIPGLNTSLVLTWLVAAAFEWLRLVSVRLAFRSEAGYDTWKSRTL